MSMLVFIACAVLSSKRDFSKSFLGKFSEQIIKTSTEFDVVNVNTPFRLPKFFVWISTVSLESFESFSPSCGLISKSKPIPSLSGNHGNYNIIRLFSVCAGLFESAMDIHEFIILKVS